MDEHLLRFNKDKTYVFIDCETENLSLNLARNLPWQISMIKVKGEEKLDFKDYYVEWDRDLNISKEAARITRFNYKKYKSSAIHIDEIFPTLDDWLNNCDYIVGHNLLGFDMYLIKGIYERAGEKYRHFMPKIIDTLSIARGIKISEEYKPGDNFLEYQYKMINVIRKGMKTSLSALGKQYDIDHDYDNLHDALVDLELNIKVWNKLKWGLEL